MTALTDATFDALIVVDAQHRFHVATNAAGGIVDGTTIGRAKDKGLDGRAHLEKNDSYPFLRATDDLLVTGPTLTNVMDLRLILVG